jgi:hypothetical protein
LASIRRALGTLPARPAVYVSIAIVVAVLTYQYGSRYLACTGQASLRDRLHAAVVGAADDGRPLVLANVMDFDWDRVEIQTEYDPGIEVPGCPLGWGWSTEERERLIADGLLTLLVFSRAGALAEYVEYRSDWGTFQELSNPYDPESAVFSAIRGDGGIVLRPLQ